MTCTRSSRRSAPARPGDVTTLVAHEPPLVGILPDVAATERARDGFLDAYDAKGSGAGMVAFIAMTSWQGEFTDDYFARPAPDPTAYGMPTEDDGTRVDPLLSRRALAITDYRPDVEALAAAPTPIVIAVGEESAGTFTAAPPSPWRGCSGRWPRCSRATTAASSAVSSARRAGPRHSPAGAGG